MTHRSAWIWRPLATFLVGFGLLVSFAGLARALITTSTLYYSPPEYSGGSAYGSTWTIDSGPATFSSDSGLKLTNTTNGTLTSIATVTVPAMADQAMFTFDHGYMGAGDSVRDVRVLVSVDGWRTWKTWNGSAWVAGNGSDVCGTGYSLYRTEHTWDQIASLLLGTSRLSFRLCLSAGPFTSVYVNMLRRMQGGQITIRLSPNPATVGQTVTAAVTVPSILATGFSTPGNHICWEKGNCLKKTVINVWPPGTSTYTHTYTTSGTRTVVVSYWFKSGAMKQYLRNHLITQSLTVADHRPSIGSVSPSSTTAGAPQFTLAVNGSNFQSTTSVVNWNGTPLATTFVSPRQLTAAIPTANVATGGLASVTVVDSATGSSNPATFTINNPVPTTTGLVPASITEPGAEFALTVSGTDFMNNSTVQWNGTSLTTSFVSPTQLRAAIPAAHVASAGIAAVTVFNPPPGGGTSNTQTFTIDSLPR
jgi:hypothetical protein